MGKAPKIKAAPFGGANAVVPKRGARLSGGGGGPSGSSFGTAGPSRLPAPARRHTSPPPAPEYWPGYPSYTRESSPCGLRGLEEGLRLVVE